MAFGIQARLDELVEEFYPDEEAPGCAVMVWRGGEPIFCVRGIADLKSGERISRDTTFRLASVSKQFTAACVLQLLERGLLRLEQRLTDFFPHFADYGHAIKLEHLLRHTSGVKDYEKLIPGRQERQITDADVLEMLGAETEGDFEAGTRFRYSNSGYAMLAMVVTAISGLEFPVYLKEQLFREAGMVDALAFVDGPGLPHPPRRAIGYEPDDGGGFRWADQNVTTAVLGDGGIYCSVADYARWIEAYFAGQVISDGMVKRAWMPGLTSGGDVVPYGYGWRLEDLGGSWAPYHPGSTSGFRNGVVLNVEKRCAALVLTNRCNGDAVAVARAALAVGDGEI